MSARKLLIFTYYWPPSGGAGVQRWLKLTKYLVRAGWEPVVITVDEKEASYLQLDPSLMHDVHEGLRVIRTASIEPVNWYGKMVGKKQVPTAGFSNVDNRKPLQKLVNSLRSNLFIPDPRRGWNYYALKAARKLLKTETFAAIITTSPPHSSQLIGRTLHRETGIPWIADLRDPWTDIYYYPQLGHTALSHQINLGFERSVLLESTKLITVSQGLKDLFAEKDPRIAAKETAVIPNGFDPDDFPKESAPFPAVFTITYTGTMADTYQPQAFFEAVKLFREQKPEATLTLRFVGKLSDNLLAYAQNLGLGDVLDLVPYVPHAESIQYLLKSSVLLLVIPVTDHAGGILTGKVFEYLASQRPILSLGPVEGDAAAIISGCEAGQTFERESVHDMAEWLTKHYQLHQQGNLPLSPKALVVAYSREAQAEAVVRLLEN